MESASVFERICGLLDARSVAYQVLCHAPVLTSEEAAQVRGTSLASGAKALICKADDDYLMVVMPADLRLASKSLRKLKGWKKLRFASADEVLEMTGLLTGSIPPFGSLFGLTTLCDERLAAQDSINFNAGDRSISIGMAATDYLDTEQPELGPFAEA
ncbi:MAG: hypothetical protein DWQ35_17235 [Planctomycetota bacterium]|nr:MAG: hypothetical protein DWQ35_17235 [Planctomycetota bacterium]REK28240.1 MAG: hypothetical protein DWQ42_05615 [Planctomycetota bacterium]REK42484.1 MAG: hypothetical protein DWQ46_13255 [Planctomycetota bacterium]